jgi:hypothetical protein
MIKDNRIFNRRPLVADAIIGATLALMLIGIILVGGRIWGQKPAVWMCEDTTYTRTGPEGFDVIGPTVRPIPGCGD